MNDLMPKITRKELKSIEGSVREEGQTLVPFENDNGQVVMVSKAQLLSALIWNEAMPLTEETGKYELGSSKYVEMVRSCDKVDDANGANALENALEAISKRIAENKEKKESENTITTDFEVQNAEDAETTEADGVVDES